MQAAEVCVDKARFAMPASEVLLDDHFVSCTCDEYLAGVSGVVDVDALVVPQSSAVPRRMYEKHLLPN